MIEVRLNPSGQLLELHLGPNRGQMTWRDVNDRAAPLLHQKTPAAFMILVPQMPRARDFQDMLAALPAIRQALATISRVAIVTNTPPVDCLASTQALLGDAEVRHFLPSDKRRAARWLDAAVATKTATAGEAAVAGALSSGGLTTEEGAETADGAYHIDDSDDADSDIDDWFIKS